MTMTERIAELREYAREDRVRCNESSIADLLIFPGIIGMEGPYLFMEDSGNVRALWRNPQWRFGIDFYGERKARLIVCPVRSGGRKAEISYFTLAGMPAKLSEESFLAFVKEHLYEHEEPEESQTVRIS